VRNPQHLVAALIFNRKSKVKNGKAIVLLSKMNKSTAEIAGIDQCAAYL
jgi:hypothetical protein